MRYEISRAHIRDLPRVKPLWKAMLKRYADLAGTDFPVRDPNEAWARRHEEYLGWLNDGAGMVFLAQDTEDDNKVVGYAAVHFTTSGSAFDMGERLGELESLAVAEEVRGEGIGTQLIDACRGELRRREIRYWSLDTLDANAEARRLYERAGFTPFMLRMIQSVEEPLPVDPVTAPLVLPADMAGKRGDGQVPAPDSLPPVEVPLSVAASARVRASELDAHDAGSGSAQTPRVREAGLAARAAARTLGQLTRDRKDAALRAMAQALRDGCATILEANAADVARARQDGTPDGIIDRLSLNEARVAGIADALAEVAALPDPVGEVVRGSTLANGLQIRQVRVPFGVVGMIYEARPNVTVDAAGLALKSGNAVILRGGSAAADTNAALVAVLRGALAGVELPEDAVQLLEGGHEEAASLMRARGLVDVIIPRGGARLIEAVVTQSQVPVIETGSGNVHVYVDRAADLNKAHAIVINAKTQRPSVCNAAETLLVHTDVAWMFFPGILPALAEAGVVLHGDARTVEAAQRLGVPMSEASEEDWATEYHGLEMAVGVVDSLDAALDHVARYSTGHTEAIVTEDRAAARRWTAEVDAAVAMVNASTRFTDGGEFGFGAEIGISTQKLHARGPMALPELTSTKWIVEGEGHVRA